MSYLACIHKSYRIIKGLLVCSLLAALAGCELPQEAETNTTKFSVTIASINENTVLVSDVVKNGAMLDDYVEIVFWSALKNVGGYTFYDPYQVGIESSYDFILLHTYTVTYQRSDGGPAPAPFTARCNITLKPTVPAFDTETPPEPEETTAEIAVVLAFLKNQAPLRSLHTRGQIYASAEITFYGQDGYGNNLMVRGYLPISFGNFTD